MGMNKHRYIKEILHIIEWSHISSDISSDNIFKTLKKIYPLLGIWTVYRNLSELMEEWKIMKTVWILDYPLYEVVSLHMVT